MEKAEDLTVSAEFDAALYAAEQAAPPLAASPAKPDEAERFLAENPDLRTFLPELVSSVEAYLGPAEVSLSVATGETGEEELVVLFSAPLGFEEASDRMRRFYAEH